MTEDKNNKLNEFNAIKEQLETEGYTAKNCTVSMSKANLLALLTIPPCIVLIISWCMRWNIIFSLTGLIDFYHSLSLSTLFLMLIALVGIIVVHEFLHGISWFVLCRDRWKSIRFGIAWKTLTPYCHCKEPLHFIGYLIGVTMPLLVLGILPFIVAMYINSVWLIIFSIFNITAAGGDIIIIFMLLKHRKALIIDHPTECGFVAFEK